MVEVERTEWGWKLYRGNTGKKEWKARKKVAEEYRGRRKRE